MKSRNDNLRIGFGYDVHKFTRDRALVLGGVPIDFPFGLEGHSDADVLVHSIIDSLLGASGLGDIGSNFPDTDMKFKDIRSIHLLEEVTVMLDRISSRIINIDSTVICERPKILPYIETMKSNISGALKVLDVKRIGIKGKTSEGLGYIGRNEGIAVHTVCLIEFI